MPLRGTRRLKAGAYGVMRNFLCKAGGLPKIAEDGQFFIDTPVHTDYTVCGRAVPHRRYQNCIRSIATLFLGGRGFDSTLISMIRSLPKAVLLLLLACSSGLAQQAAKNDVSAALLSAEDLYRHAQFEEASSLLRQIEPLLSSVPARVEDLKKLKLYQALIDVALNDSQDAKARFLELLALEPGFSLNSEEHAPKVLLIFADARKSFLDAQCKAACTDCEAANKAGDLQKAVNIIKSFRLQCECARKISGSLAFSLVERGTAAFELRDYPRALNEFKLAQDADPDNPAAAELSARAASQLQKAAADGLAEWKNYFESRDYRKAASTYERVVLLSADARSNAADQIQTEYRKLFDRDKQLWAQACSREDAMTMDSLRQEVRAVDPSGNLNRDLLRQIQSCPVSGCTPVESVMALSRLKSRVDPKVDPSLRPYTSKIAVKIRIDDKGKVAVLDIDNPAGNRLVSEAVRDAVQLWKFDPALAARSETRCVVTEFLLQFEQ
jgi:tetratricopeptide (TPR) repeat protein